MYNAFGNLLQKKISVFPPPFFSDGRLLEASILPKIAPKITILASKLGDGLLLEHGHLLARLHEVQKSYCSHHYRTRSRSRSTLLKFSRSLYLGNYSSESLHTWTIGT